MSLLRVEPIIASAAVTASWATRDVTQRRTKVEKQWQSRCLSLTMLASRKTLPTENIDRCFYLKPEHRFLPRLPVGEETDERFWSAIVICFVQPYEVMCETGHVSSIPPPDFPLSALLLQLSHCGTWKCLFTSNQRICILCWNSWKAPFPRRSCRVHLGPTQNDRMFTWCVALSI